MIRRIRKAFTMLELIMVIVITGIVGKFGVELLFQAYNYYLYNMADNRFQAQSEAAVQQIANRLQYRIPGSEIVRQSNAGLNNYTPIATVADDNSAITILEWVGYDIDGWRGDGNGTLPTWSGFIDIEMTKANGTPADLNTPETNASRILAVWSALSPSNFNGTGAGLFFVQDTNFNVRDGFGWNGVAVADQTRTVHRVDVVNGNNNRVTATAGTGTFSGQNIYEFYKLSWTAYALEHNATSGELKLYYDYRPWNGQTYANGTSVLLMENVDTFRFRSAGDAMKIQVCIRDAKLFNNAGEFSICKEKTVF